MTPTSSCWGRIPQAVASYGVGRSKLYQLAAENRGLFRKLGAVTLVDFKRLDAIMAALPAAEVNAPRGKREAATLAKRDGRHGQAIEFPAP